MFREYRFRITPSERDGRVGWGNQNEGCQLKLSLIFHDANIEMVAQFVWLDKTNVSLLPFIKYAVTLPGPLKPGCRRIPQGRSNVAIHSRIQAIVLAQLSLCAEQPHTLIPFFSNNDFQITDITVKVPICRSLADGILITYQVPRFVH